MSKIKVGDKVRIQPQAAEKAGVLPGDFTRGWTVLEVHQPLEAARGIRVATAKVQRRQGDGCRWFQLEHLTHDVDLPYDPKPPQKTLAEKELEVLQQDPIRRRWMELLGPQANTEDFAAEVLPTRFVPAENFHHQAEALKPAPEPKPTPKRVDMPFRGISRGDTVLCPYAGNGQKREVGDHVWDRMYSTTPSRKGTVEKAFEGFSSFLVRWADGGASVRQPGTLGHAVAAPKAFKKGDRVRRTGAPFQSPGTISALTNLFIEIQWDDGSKTAGAFDQSVNWLEHE